MEKQAKPSREKVLTNAFVSIVQSMKIEDDQISKTLGVDKEYLNKLRADEKKIELKKDDGKAIATFIQAMGNLYSLVGGKDEKAIAWLNEANKAFDNKKPIELMQEGGGLTKLAAYLKNSNKSH